MKLGDIILDCPVCEGSGFIPDPYTDGFLDVECEHCEGNGWVEAENEHAYSS